ncbi:MAG: RDD family protein, partial [Lentisphaeria bacterium]|nr:RDD family protein [Lentisphaeria bacterium]
LDLVVLALLGVCGLLILRLVGKPLSDQSAVQKTVCWTIFFYLCWLYSAVLESCAWQTTLGKLALGLRVEADDLERIDFGRSSVRSLLKMISALPAFLGFWLAARDPARRAMHDRVARTRVVGIPRPTAAAVPAITPDAAPQAQSAATARNMALAVVTSGDATSVTEQMVRELIDTDLERNPHLSASVAAIQGVMITEDASVSTEAYAQDMMTCYMGHMTHGGWTRPTGLHVFQAPLGQGRIHIAYGT